MSDTPVLVIAKFIARSGQDEALSLAIERCIAPSRQEAGCIHYDVYKSFDDKNTFLIHERWENDAAIQFHFAQPHFKRLITETQPLLVVEPDIQRVNLSVN